MCFQRGWIALLSNDSLYHSSKSLNLQPQRTFCEAFLPYQHFLLFNEQNVLWSVHVEYECRYNKQHHIKEKYYIK